FFLLRERPVARSDRQVWVDAGHSLKLIFASRTLWSAIFLLLLFFIAPGFSTPLLYLEQDRLHFSQLLIGYLDAAGGASAMAGAFIYSVLIRKVSLRRLLTVGIFINAGGALLFYFFKSEGSALDVIIVNGFFGTLGVMPLFDLATRATPRGGEAMGYALMMSVRNLALFASDYFGSWLVEHHLHIAIAGATIIDHPKFSFYQLIWLNAGSTLLALIAVPFLPRAVMNRREGEELNEPGVTGEQISAVEPASGEV
ncbi:MAG: MFS transporter, partial [Chloroflexi bacterium]|nr:MFS transporter [Chloroflexota bacterium]